MESDWDGFMLELEELCRRLGKPDEEIRQALVYLKTQKAFRGVPKAELRRFSRSFAHSHRDWGGEEVKDWVERILREADCLDKQFAGLYVLGAFKGIFDLEMWNWMWEKLVPLSDDWSLTDAFVNVTTGFLERVEGLWQDLQERVKSPNRWARRLAITSPIIGVRKGHPEWVPEACRIIELAIDDQDPFVQKAISWTLRESSKGNPEEVVLFLRSTGSRMKHATVREAIRNLQPHLRESLIDRLGSEAGSSRGERGVLRRNQ